MNLRMMSVYAVAMAVDADAEGGGDATRDNDEVANPFCGVDRALLWMPKRCGVLLVLTSNKSDSSSRRGMTHSSCGAQNPNHHKK